MQVPTLRRDLWLGALDKSFQLLLLIQRVDQLQRRYVMLSSTTRQQAPESGRALDDSAARVQVVDGIHQPGNGPDQSERLAVERRVRILEPCPGDGLITPDNCIERPIKRTNRVASSRTFARVATYRSRFAFWNGRFRDPNDGGERLIRHANCSAARSADRYAGFRGTGRTLGLVVGILNSISEK
jgi:hypothetical protein